MGGSIRSGRRVSNASRILILACALVTIPCTSAYAQSIKDALSFLLTNRSIATGDFAGDEQAAAATRDTISSFLLTELGSLPISSSASGFSYEMDPGLGGVPTRATASFGPFFTERALTSGARHFSLATTFQYARFDKIDGRQLGDGTLVATASRLTSEPEPFDVETLTLRLSTATTTFSATAGLTDRLDVSVAVPVTFLTLEGKRVDTFRGTSTGQATASATASGLGDMAWRAKFNLWHESNTAFAVIAEGRLPTGRTEDLLGLGRYTFRPRIVVSHDGARVALNADAGYVFGSFSDEFDYGLGMTGMPNSRMTLVGEVVGRRLSDATRLTDVAAPHPRLVGVETIRLTATPDSTNRVVAVAGIKYNVAAAWLMTANVSHFLSEAGLTAGWIPAVSLEYSFGG
jgi:hypothetical protein